MTATVAPPPPRTSAPHQTDLEARAPRQRRTPERIAAVLTLLALAGIAVAALIEIDISVPAMLESWSNAERFFTRVGGLAFPEWPELLELTGLTLGLVLCGTLFAAVVSIPVAYLAAANTTPGRSWRASARFLGVFTRALPDVVLAMVFVLMFSLGSLPGILAIGIHSIGMISKMFADAIEQIDEGPRLAIRAAGGSKLQEFTSGVLPQVLPSWVATVLHRNDINLRGSVILGYVGVAGLGLEMSTAFKSLDYSLGLGIALVIFVLCVAMEVVSSLVRAAMLGGHEGSRNPIDRLVDRIRGSRGTSRSGQLGGARRFRSPAEAIRRRWNATRVSHVVWGWVAALVVVAAVTFADINWLDFLTFWARIPEIAVQFWPPSFGVYDLATMLEAMRDTIAIAFAATLLTFLVSLVIGSLAARNVAPNRTVQGGMRLLLVGIRGIPEVILAIVLIIITGLGTQAGTIALAIGGIGLLGKLIADSFEEVRRGPETALRATGATRLQTYASATLPQGMPALIGHTFYLLDTNIRAATLLGIVGGGGVGYYLLNAGQGSNYPLVTAIVLMILVTVLLVEGLAMWMRRVFR
ncbi:phosphonate ABC transporter, permease protein PhnE [Pseudoclavibacter sp. RFBJ3]|uniref:phosphonate ABC transporter, permease protein PhnE n=1 Tax=unclassified Pseudoclavibacter TaxID=2615177 RepID=UPI000CE8833A|nr:MULTISPECIES: phosphonate ABC transporter, permease protein PhnE [unclassified Pseudoclavibacter]PPF87210.1 phosphonate ABC transporter, permease protein PhnE [Pseudoclavibacter sp. RFBJ5]PPF89433.1 phosphonate ABC transporter, permease protein PhnE [Pseudoclavibacter sp. RFBJ3]PPG00762.1 phosphonate ABC transporter, permease protein PhnE [Pseudoclavibacter sp. RFBH5]PPG18870.1 phosphonate ABC transporter, permease protein PhnE [Pseudoclavibacter sp. RFBI4]